MEFLGFVCGKRVKLAAFGPLLRQTNICKPALENTLMHERYIPEPMINQM
jgi:hypothetical protein|tara:strand:- start:291 stop:440 length:150 start_codon:yes stop_codon:yes gene_type:complete